MDKESALEIYKQRYETFRHLDRLRWQMVQLTIAIFTATALVVRVSSGDLEWWFEGALGLGLMGLSFSMFKISKGLIANQIVLKDAAKTVGDCGIPDLNARTKSVFHWISISVGVAGASFLIKTISNMFGVVA